MIAPLGTGVAQSNKKRKRAKHRHTRQLRVCGTDAAWQPAGTRPASSQIMLG